jgi:hypothetical protein
MRREYWEPKHTFNLVLIVVAIAAIVALSIWADGAHVTEVFAFVAGLLVPGSPVPTVTGGDRR